MPLQYTPHEKLILRSHPDFDEAWLQERIREDPTILGLGEVQLLDHERTLSGGGRLDLLLFDEDTNRRYEVELMLGATNPDHLVRTIEYWDLERRRYPGYEHVAVIVAEDITSRFLNVIGLFSGSIPIMAIQLDALRVQDKILLNFVRVMDQTELRIDDTEVESEGVETTRSDWEQRAGSTLMEVCDEVLAMVNANAQHPHELSYMRQYIGLKAAGGRVNNFVTMRPRKTSGTVHIGIRNTNCAEWRRMFEDLGVPTRLWRKKFRITIGREEFEQHKDLIDQVIRETEDQVKG
tara:strand:+ start:33377 stop:34255 length:879 start_codon:yes stop_codon:yes gene_type:complete